MRTSDELFKLIKALKPSEKRYFKIYAKKHVLKGKNNYLKLFEVIERQEVYDEDLVIAHFPGQTFVKHLSSLKPYLFKLILESLHLYHTDIASGIKEQIHWITILYEKGLYASGYKMLVKIKESAASYERFCDVLEILEWEERYLFAMLDVRKMEDIHLEKGKVLKKIDNYNSIKILSTRMSMLAAKMGASRKLGDTGLMRACMNHRLLKNVSFILSEKGKIYFYHSHITFSIIQGQPEKQYDYSLMLISLFEKSNHLMSEEIRWYILAVNNFLYACLRLRRYKDFDDFIGSFKKVPEKFRLPESVAMRIYILSSHIEMSKFLMTGEFGLGIRKILEVQHTLDRSMVKMDKIRIQFFYNYSQLYFGAGDLKNALHWCNMVIREPEADIRQDIQSFARIFNLVIHYELGNQDLLEYAIRSTYRFLRKRERLYEFEKIVIDFLRKGMTRLYNDSELMQAFQDLKKRIEDISKNPFERKALEYFDFISWLESKIQRKPFAEIVKSKAGFAG